MSLKYSRMAASAISVIAGTYAETNCLPLEHRRSDHSFHHLRGRGNALAPDSYDLLTVN